MTNEETIEESKEIVYSKTTEINDQNLELENKALIESNDRLENDKIVLGNTVQKLREETTLLGEMFSKTNEELNNLKKPSLLLAEISNLVDDNVIVKIPNGNKFYSSVAKDVENIQVGDFVLVDQKTLNVVKKVSLSGNLEVEKYIILEKPTEKWKDIGGLKKEIEEVKEVIELPLKKPELFKAIGIKPPKGILLYGPPGTGKTLLAKAVAQSTNATFIEVVGSELVQKFIGEGAKLVKEIFNLARQRSPTIVFIDEIDALAATRMETGTSGEREVNRTFMQLLAELDGFKCLDNVKIIGATNRIDILDHAIIRPGRLDRLIEVNLPDEEGVLEIFKVHTKEMSLSKIKMKELANEMNGFSGAEIRAVCTEAGYFAIRDNRNQVTQKDFLKAIEKIQIEDEDDYDHQKFFG
jgi:proteasome regulatory subunit